MPFDVLYYNWAPYFHDPIVGGGISVYLRNLLDHVHEHPSDYTASFLYSGFDYTLASPRLRARKVRNARHPGMRTFSLVNSPVPAPSFLSFSNPAGSVSNRDLEECFRRFLQRAGPFRIIHFHSLEGLTATCLRTAKESGAKVVLTLHNYWAVCPQVQLWQFESQPCTDFLQGRACVSCLTDRVETELALTHRRLNKGRTLPPNTDPSPVVKVVASARFPSSRGHLGRSRTASNPLQAPFVLHGGQLPQLADRYRQRRDDIVDLINQNVDLALSVSRRTTEIHTRYGLEPRLLATQSIGTKATEFAAQATEATGYDGTTLRMAYLGESRRDKGFFFLLDELRRLPKEDLGRIDLLLACRVTDPSELRMAAVGRGRLLSLAQSLNLLSYRPGYAPTDLPRIVTGVHLGVVPALWEDNLPQVALELLGCRIPVLCSSRGGAQEYVRHPAFVFDPGKDGDFTAKLRNIMNHPGLLHDFWRLARLPKSMGQHVAELTSVYHPFFEDVSR
jgi:glycosyltransferase involved in cell wall biosynthesis